jgi:hypothetical protein
MNIDIYLFCNEYPKSNQKQTIRLRNRIAACKTHYPGFGLFAGIINSLLIKAFFFSKNIAPDRP